MNLGPLLGGLAAVAFGAWLILGGLFQMRHRRDWWRRIDYGGRPVISSYVQAMRITKWRHTSRMEALFAGLIAVLFGALLVGFGLILVEEAFG